MKISDWLMANKDKFVITNDASTPFVDYEPNAPLSFKGEKIELISVRIGHAGSKACYNDMGRSIFSADAETDFQWTA